MCVCGGGAHFWERTEKYSWRSYRSEQTGNGASLISGNAVVKDSKLGRGILSKTDKQNTLIPLNKQNGICFKLTIRLSLNFSNKNGGGGGNMLMLYTY